MSLKHGLLAGLAAACLLLIGLLAGTAGPAAAQGGPTATPRPLYDMPDPNALRVYRSSVIALATTQRFLYTANTFSGTASVVDIAAKSITAEIPVGADPRAVALDPEGAWLAVTSRGEGTVSLIDLRRRTHVGSVRIGAPVSRLLSLPPTGSDHSAHACSCPRAACRDGC